MKLLVVEDDRKLASFLARAFGEEEFEVELCASGAAALKKTKDASFDVVVLDWMLPEGDGLEVCRQLRARGCDVPILMLTARAETRDRVQALDGGADDYLVKPFEIDELLARVRALHRRARPTPTIALGPIEIDPIARRARLDGAPMVLTAKELALLTYLVRNAGRPVPRAELLAEVWDLSFDPGSNIIEVHVSRLREKLGAHAPMLATVRGAGYVLRAEAAP